MTRPKSSKNLAKDIETPKLKHIPIPNIAKAKIILANQEMDNYLAGVVVGMGIKGRWSVDLNKMQFVIEDN